MSRKVDSVKDINDSKETWRLAVRIMDVWSVVNNKGIEHLEMIVMDSLGDRIQVLIRHDHLLKWKEAIELQNIPPKGYFFKDFGEILQGKCKTDRLEDIIGAVSEINHIQSNTPGKKVVVSVVLKDLKGNCINCNLWEIYGSKFLAYYNDPKNNGAIVILLTHAMVKDGQVSNAWSGSKLLINEDIPEIQDFMSKLPTNEQKEKPTQSPVERFVHNAKCMSLSQFCKIKHVQPTFSQASVWKLCDDEAFVKEIENDYIVEDNQSKTEYAKLVPNKENLETSAQTLSTSGENDPESIILMTPAKDVVIADKGEEVDFEASGATQLSGTKPSKKLKIEPSS
ncbi:hypothetical protein KIW84_023771 [Lathyrus oleraceus]|uniref:Replication protein A 70 kDa DNA-binding subunit B/D first OB fold domain-containing protein n=1 Tax=Pisum sativum TaxID=3888 RepID=A0A9D4YJQ8_PEA|nr:hypothetical protein KIW84_023771 [Pisum sativum]